MRKHMFLRVILHIRMSIFIITLVVTSCSEFKIPFKKVQINDIAFEKTLIKQGYDNYIDGTLEVNDKISNCWNLDLQWSGISDLTGIENFISLLDLNVSNNSLLSIDLSNNRKLTQLKCSQNQLRYLELSKNIKLTYLNCSNNKIQSLDLSSNKSLRNLNCSNNNLTRLDIRSLNSLEGLNCAGNQISSILIYQNPNLTKIYFDESVLNSSEIKNTVLLNNQLNKTNYSSYFIGIIIILIIFLSALLFKIFKR